MLEMINVELEQIEGIQKEVDAGVISVGDIQNRLTEEAAEVAKLSVDDLSQTTTEGAYYPPGKLPLLAG